MKFEKIRSQKLLEEEKALKVSIAKEPETTLKKFSSEEGAKVVDEILNCSLQQLVKPFAEAVGLFSTWWMVPGRSKCDKVVADLEQGKVMILQ